MSDTPQPVHPSVDARLASIETKVDLNHEYIRETLSRLETSFNGFTAAASTRDEEHGTRLTRLETDAKWYRAIAGPLVAVAVATVSQWAKSFLGVA